MPHHNSLKITQIHLYPCVYSASNPKEQRLMVFHYTVLCTVSHTVYMYIMLLCQLCSR